MILKKPYAFIIKHFRAINLLLLLPTFFVVASYSDIARFLKLYVKNGYSTFESGIAGKYINLWLLGTLVLLILINLLLVDLMKKKKKSSKIFVFSIIYYFILFILSLLLYNFFTSIEMGRINTTIAGFYRDIVAFLPYVGYFILAATLFRGIGFNIKTLKFDQNIDLQLTDEDAEEFEIGSNAETADFKSIAIHIIRELKYYVVENKFIVTCIVVLFLLVVASNTYINIGVYNKKYTVNENFALNNMLISVKDSYISNTDQGGNPIANNKYFLVVKLGIENTSGENMVIELKNFRIDINKKSIFPTYDVGNKFIDIAKNYDGKAIPPKRMAAADKPKYICQKGYYYIDGMCSNKKEKIAPEIEHNYYCPEHYELKGDTCDLPIDKSEYVIVYTLTKDQLKRSYQMKILSRLTNQIGELNPSYKMIKFKPTNLINKEDLGSLELGKEIDLKETMLKETKLKINKIEVVPSYIYDYKTCTKDYCITKKDVVTAKIGRVLLVIDDKISYDKTSSFYLNTNHEFYKYFGKVSYKYNNKEYTNLITDVTPSNLKDKHVYEISSLINQSTNKKLIISIRNKFFSIKFD